MGSHRSSGVHSTELALRSGLCDVTRKLFIRFVRSSRVPQDAVLLRLPAITPDKSLKSSPLKKKKREICRSPKVW